MDVRRHVLYGTVISDDDGERKTWMLTVGGVSGPGLLSEPDGTISNRKLLDKVRKN
jgi:hypothetical protein